MLLEVNAPLLEERRKFDGLSLVRLARWFENYTWRGADMILPVTQVLADYVRKAGVPKSKIRVIPNGVNLARFAQAGDRRNAKQRLGLQDRLVLGFTGFMREWHGLEHVIDFLAETCESGPLHLLLVGDGPARKNLEQRAKERGVEDRMTITGIVGRDQIARYVSAYDVALQPAVVPYASPLKLFEYLALGCAIVAPATPNILEILTDERNAVLFARDDPGDFRRAVKRVCEDAELRMRISEGAVATIHEKGLTWKTNAQTVVNLFSRLGVKAVRQPAGE
jgi:glycosyltransferase involved in cell wall biosynthesis